MESLRRGLEVWLRRAAADLERALRDGLCVAMAPAKQ
jgi:hypothetical protein